VRLGKPITVHTREADEDTEKILKAEVPIEHKVQWYIFSRGIVWASTSYTYLALTCRPPSAITIDTCPLLYRLSRIWTALVRSFPQPPHWHHWHVFQLFFPLLFSHVNITTPA
jgi:hypothetical protein